MYLTYECSRYTGNLYEKIAQAVRSRYCRTSLPRFALFVSRCQHHREHLSANDV